MEKAMKRLRLTQRKVDRAVIALEALLESDLPEGPDWISGAGTPRHQIETVLWDVIQPLDRLFRDDDDVPRYPRGDPMPEDIG